MGSNRPKTRSLIRDLREVSSFSVISGAPLEDVNGPRWCGDFAALRDDVVVVVVVGYWTELTRISWSIAQLARRRQLSILVPSNNSPVLTVEEILQAQREHAFVTVSKEVVRRHAEFWRVVERQCRLPERMVDFAESFSSGEAWEQRLAKGFEWLTLRDVGQSRFDVSVLGLLDSMPGVRFANVMARYFELECVLGPDVFLSRLRQLVEAGLVRRFDPGEPNIHRDVVTPVENWRQMDAPNLRFYGCPI